jgi:hypothetical protein
MAHRGVAIFHIAHCKSDSQPLHYKRVSYQGREFDLDHVPFVSLPSEKGGEEFYFCIFVGGREKERVGRERRGEFGFVDSSRCCAFLVGWEDKG